MQNKILLYQKLAELFKEKGYSLYLVGGTVRDYLLNLELTDLDVVTDATPDEMKSFLDGADFTFSHLGFVKYKFERVPFDITTLRKEEGYKDFRHPNKIIFVKYLKEDFVRRDFTINAMYMDASLNVIDYVDGQSDLKNHILKMVGSADSRIKEDPLRILRAIRFALEFDLSFDKNLEKAIKDNIRLLDKLNIEKVKQEIKKIKGVEIDKISNIFNYFSIQYLLKVVD